MNEFEGMRCRCKKAFQKLINVASTFDIPIALPLTWPILEPSHFDFSKYYREFEEITFIDGGGFGSVFKVRNMLDETVYAVKKIFLKLSDFKANSIMLYLSEVRIIASLSHQNVVNYKAAWLEPMIETNNKKKRKFKMYTDSKDINISKTSSENPNFENSLLKENPKESTRDKSYSNSITFENSDRLKFNCEYDMSYADSLTDSEDLEEESTSLRDENGNLSTAQELNRSRVNLKWATLHIQMTYCDETLKHWLVNRNRHMTDSRRSSEDFKLRHIDCVESACLDSPHFAYPSTWTHLDVLINMFKQLVKGLRYIHFRGITHHDIKPSNIFVVKADGGYSIQLGDFGLACATRQSHIGIQLGTPLYAAPEQLEGQCNPLSDVFSAGVILCEMMETFVTEMERIKTIKNLRDGQIPVRLKENYPEIAHIISKLVQRDPTMRPDANQLLIELQSLSQNQTIETLVEYLTINDVDVASLETNFVTIT